MELKCGVCPKSGMGPLSPHVCSNCELPFLMEKLDFFEVMSVPKRFSQDIKALEKRYYELSRALHPDRFSATGQKDLQKRSLDRMSLVNQAYTTLKSPESRRLYLLELLGSKADSKVSVPMDLAETWFEIQDEGGARVDAFFEQVQNDISECNLTLGRLEERYDDQPELPGILSEIQSVLNQRTTLESLLRDVRKQCRIHYKS